MTLQRVPINNFRGGLNTRDGPFDLQPNESPDLLNVTISSLVGQLKVRNGKTKIDSAGMPEKTSASITVDFAKQAVLGSTPIRMLMLSINGSVYALTPAGEVKKLFKGTEGTVWDFEQFADVNYKDWVWMGNGVDAMQKWDGEAGATVEWKATKGELPKGGVLCVWENRMFISYVTGKKERVFFSEFSDPEATIKEYGFVDVRGPEDELDAVQDLAVLGSRLFVLKRRSVFYISSPVTMANRRVGGPGAFGRFQTCEMEDKLYFFNPQGIFGTAGVSVTMESGSINNWFPENINPSQLERVRIVATKDTYPRLLLSVPLNNSETNNRLIEMIPHINFRRIGGRRYLLLPAFMMHTLAATALAAWNPTGHEETIVAGGEASPYPALPVIAVSDSFKRAPENPLNNVGKWETLKLEEGEAARNAGRVSEEFWTNEAFTKAFVWWSAEVTNPEVRILLHKLTPQIGITFFMCMTKAGTKEPAYYWVEIIEIPSGSGKWNMRMNKVEKGKLTTLVGEHYISQVLVAGDELGCTVVKNEIILWRVPSGGKPEILALGTDSSLTKGKCGLRISSGQAVGSWQISNFSIAEWKAPTNNPTAIQRLFNGLTDENVPIEAHWQSSWIPIQEMEPKERIRRLNVDISGDAFADVFTDFEEKPRFSAELPKSESGEADTKWEGGKWEGGIWGISQSYRFARVRPETRGRYHSVRFRTVPGGQPFFINSAELAIRGGKEH